MLGRAAVPCLVAALIATLAFGQCVDCIKLADSKSCCQRAKGKACPMPMPSQSRPGDCPNPDGILGSAQLQRAPAVVAPDFQPAEEIALAEAFVPQLSVEIPPVTLIHSPPDIFITVRNLRI
jgi:hypothetical protein